MVSKLYEADNFYQMQRKGLIASTYDKRQKLHKDSKGFYLNRQKSNGKIYKQRVGNKDKVYTRQETGVTKYTPEIDREKLDVRTKRQTGKEHEVYTHMYDRKAKSTGKRYKI